MAASSVLIPSAEQRILLVFAHPDDITLYSRHLLCYKTLQKAEYTIETWH